MKPNKRGTVYLVGAGPGAPDYLTLRAADLLGRADVVVYDNLVGEGILEHFAPGARAVYVGKQAGRHTKSQEEIGDLLVTLAGKHDAVVRLKGGDPYIFGRGAEEASVLREAGVRFETVPGVTAAQGASATAGIPLTHRETNASVTLVTGHEDPTKKASTLDYEALARCGALVFYMGVGRLAAIASALVDRGLSPDTPAMIVRNATLSDQQTVAGTVADIARRASEAGIRPPALVFIGTTVSYQPALDWFSGRPLFGRAVVVTRARAQASVLSDRLRGLGARVVEFPSIEIRPVAGKEREKIDRTARSLSRWDWIVFTSVNGVEIFRDRLLALGLDARAFAGLRLVAIGPATGERLETYGLRPDFLPSRYTSEALAAGLPAKVFAGAPRFLLARAREGNPQLARDLRKRGARVSELVLYDTVPARTPAGPVKKRLRDGTVDAVTFTSSSTVRYFQERVGPRNFKTFSKKTAYVSIGPVTSQTIRDLGAEPAAEARTHTIPGLVQTLTDYFEDPARQANQK